MEIDLNCALSEGKFSLSNGNQDKGGGGGNYLSSFCSSTTSISTSTLLWHACAGPLTRLPKKGSLVVYFPQGHLEQIAFQTSSMPTFDLQPHIVCRVINVELLANKLNDEAYTQVTLFPELEVCCSNAPMQLLDESWILLVVIDFVQLGKKIVDAKENEEMGVEEECSDGGPPSSSTSHMFCKTLTASDTSTHGGFSVPRRAAEDCFPPLDYMQQRPSQEIVAKDLHGVEWRFRHIYRGQPRRHLLTTGWSNFVSQKNLVSGDAVIFLRGEDGELRLGVRRACQSRNSFHNFVSGNKNLHGDVLSAVANAISTKSMFHVFYCPRGSLAEYVIPYNKYMKSITHPVTIGTPFKMNLKIEDRAERRCSGIVTGIGDIDPQRWPGSKWRCLKDLRPTSILYLGKVSFSFGTTRGIVDMVGIWKNRAFKLQHLVALHAFPAYNENALQVRWDVDLASSHQEQISPWEIVSSIYKPSLSVPSTTSVKNFRTDLKTPSVEYPITAGADLFMDSDVPMRSSKVLQGQEKLGFSSPHYRGNKATLPTYIGTESARFQVLQGQEINPLRLLHERAKVNHMAQGNSNLSCNMFNTYHRSYPGFYPLSLGNTGTMYMPFHEGYKTDCDQVRQPYMTSCQAETFKSNISSVKRTLPDAGKEEVSNPSPHNFLRVQRPFDNSCTPATHIDTEPQRHKDNIMDGASTGCKLFGFSLNGQLPTLNLQNSNRSCTKVHKQGNLVGRAIDLSKLNGYDDLLNELERLFNMEGLLRIPDKGWQVVYTDSEDDMMVVGDDPWKEFCKIVSKIHIYTQEEVEKMTIGIGSDDTQSCLEEAPV
ncbi:hypothetical protein IFM89_000507 [Coptis chinensis]|uniref:Auxin response factor n=1 Tax=Coptis chinensis TaxID=261450 RepID=A0A835LFV9_9MAGN|nr:hypothetical protein IFM89_000507 [Coptis chinensis]